MKIMILLCLLPMSTMTAGSGQYPRRGWRPLGMQFTLSLEDDEELKTKRQEIKETSQETKNYSIIDDLPNSQSGNSEQELPEVKTERSTVGNEKSVEDVNKDEDYVERIDYTNVDSADEEVTKVPDLTISTKRKDYLTAEVNHDNITDTQINNMADLLHLISEQDVEDISKEDSAILIEKILQYGLSDLKYNTPKEPQVYGTN